VDDSKRLEMERRWDRLVGLIKERTGESAGDVEKMLRELFDKI